MAGVVINNVLLASLPNTEPGNLTVVLETQSDMPLVTEAYMRALNIIFIACVPLMGGCLLSTFFIGNINLEPPVEVIQTEVVIGQGSESTLVRGDVELVGERIDEK